MEIVRSGIEISGNELDGLRSCACACSSGFDVSFPEDYGSASSACACGCGDQQEQKTNVTFMDALRYLQ